MILAPTDFAAFSQATGTPYPDSAQQKAALTPIVSEWKSRQQAAATDNRGPNALTVGLGIAGAAGLGAAGLAAFNALRRKGLDDATAAQIAKETQVEAQKLATTAAPNAPEIQSTNAISRTPNPVAVQRNRSGQIAYQTGFLAPGNIRGTAESRRRQEYSNTSLWNDSTYGPLLRAATTPQLQQELVNSISLDDPALASQLAAAIELRNSPTAGPVRSVKSEADLPDPSRVPEGVAYRVADTKALLTTRRSPGGKADWIAADASGVRTRLAADGRSAYGSVSPDELAEGEAIRRPDRKNRAMQQPGYFLPDEAGGAVIQANTADLSPAAIKEGYATEDYDGSSILVDAKGNPVRFGARGTSALLNRPIAWSDLAAPSTYDITSDEDRPLNLTIDREDEATRGGLESPPASRTRRGARFNLDATGPDLTRGFSVDPLSGIDPATAQDFRVEEPSWTVQDDPDARLYRTRAAAPGQPASVAVGLDGQVIPWDTIRQANAKGAGLSNRFYEWKPDAPRPQERLLARDASGNPLMVQRPATPQDLWVWQDKLGLDAPGYYGKTVGELPRGDIQDDYIQAKPSDTLARAAGAFNNQGTRDRATLDAIAQQYAVPPREIAEAAARLRGDIDLPTASGFRAPAAHAVGGRTHTDWLTQALSALQAAPRPAESVTTAALMAEDPAARAAAARGWLGNNSEIAESLATILSPLPAADRLSVVAEGLGNAARDFKPAIDWASTTDPELASHLTGGRGTPSFDQFAKSYVRRFALGAVAEEANAGSGRAALINLPADVSELIGTEAVRSGRSPDAVINEMIGSADSPIDALWKLDGVLSNAASSNLDEPYTTGSKLAERFWDQAAPNDGSGVGALKGRLGATTQQAYTSLDATTPSTSRLPIAIKFGSHIKGDSNALINPDRAAVDSIITSAISGQPTITQDDSQIDPSIPASRPRSRSRLELAMGAAADNRPFPVNATLRNRAADLTSQIARVQEDGKAQGLSPEQRRAAIAPLEAEIQRLADTQLNQLDALRQEGALLLSRANEYPVTPTGERATDGRGYVLDLNPVTGKAQALPDSFAEITNSDRLDRGEDESREFFSRDQLDDLDRDSGVAPSNADADEPIARLSSDDQALIDYGHGKRSASLNFTSLGPGPDAASGAERDRALAELHRQGYGAAYQPTGGDRLTTTDHALRVARANLDRLNTLTPTPVRDMTSASTVSDADATAARASITGDYWDKVVSRGGFKPTKAGSPNLNGVSPFTPPSDAAIAGRVNFLRKRGII